MLSLSVPLDVLLKNLTEERLITPLDRHFALELAALEQENSEIFVIIAALLSHQLSSQHTCLPLAQIDFNNPFKQQVSQIKMTLDAEQLTAQLQQFNAIGSADEHKPLILDNGRLYLQRYFHFERSIADKLNRLSQQKNSIDNTELSTMLAELYPQQQGTIDWQKVATATAACQNLAVITGGPGTGKTTTVTKLLLLLCQQQTPVIKLVAPTGKAAARLSESIKASKQRLQQDLVGQVSSLDLNALKLVPEEASTLHRLLGVIPNSHKFRHDSHNPLRLDLLVVDEASMVDLPMMYKLLDALPPHAKLILLGDQDQLASVEAGAVLADICQGLYHPQNKSWQMRYSPQQSQQLSQLSGYDLSQYAQSHSGLGDSLCMLMHSHRFQGDAGIGQLANAVNKASASDIKQVWQQGYQELSWFNHHGKGLQNRGLKSLLNQAVEQYSLYLTQIHNDDIEPQTIINSYNQYRILAAMRAGDYGVDGINQSVTNALKQAKLIQPNQEFYLGRPIIIQSNDYNLGLFNGDIGIILADKAANNRLMAYFIQADGQILKVLPARLPSHETCYAMTVHKSQGSEFATVALVLPPFPSLSQWQLLTKELIYTAITRAKSHFSCLGNKKVFETASLQITKRASGLAKDYGKQLMLNSK
ncbi:exodeoxyribonuclease V subunit alpha [Shewanella marina]|uniref:exodeoxyribonuclease V subunit alpha n=1 Tax=Shewanella marina TaxID=487319 RepID=UPI0004720369|nr:exodeoxyribonuclease V subunit alpha [Shewanella marina]